VDGSNAIGRVNYYGFHPWRVYHPGPTGNAGVAPCLGDLVVRFSGAF
jgi:hypothetical protein